jgi:4-nitrophenyl phosphatase
VSRVAVDWSAVPAFIFDLDGCVYTGRQLVPGVVEVLERLRASRRRILFLTNNSRQDGIELQAKLAGLGVAADRREVLSAAEAAGAEVRRRLGPVQVMAIGSPTLMRLLAEAGHMLVDLGSRAVPQAVVIGHDDDFSYGKLADLARVVAGGAAFFAVNVDPQLPLEGGTFLPGCGALVEAVAVASGVRPEIIGKPRPTLFRAALARLGVSPQEAAMVGDSLLADIQGAQAIGLKTIWLAPPGATPDVVRADLTIQAFGELLARLP